MKSLSFKKLKNVFIYFFLLVLYAQSSFAGTYNHTNNGSNRERYISVYENETNTYRITSSSYIHVKWYQDVETQGSDVERDENTRTAERNASFSSTGSHFIKAEIFTTGWDPVCYVKWNITVSNPDTQGPYAPGNLRMTSSYDTGKSTSDGITYQGNPRFQWSEPNDPGNSGINQYQWAVTSSSSDPWSGTLIKDDFTTSTYVRPGTLSNGDYKFWVQAEDNATPPNWGEWTDTDFTIDTTDPITPYNLINPSSPTDDTTPNVYWSGSDSGGSGIDAYYVEFSKGSTDYTFTSSNTSLSNTEFNGVSLSDGNWSWRVHVVDIAGNDSWSSSKSITIQTDTQGPYAPGNLRMTSSYDTGKSTSDGITYQGNPRFQWSEPNDPGNSGINQYQWAVTSSSSDPWSGTLIKDDFTTSTYVRPGTLSNGDYKFWVQAEDNATPPNWGEWTDTDFTIDTTDPITPYNLINPSSPTDDTTPNVYWSGSDSGGSGIYVYYIEFSEGSTTYTFTSSASDTFLSDTEFTTPLSDGNWSWRVHAVDIAGNDSWSSSEPIVIESDTQDPAISNWLVSHDGSGQVTAQLVASDDTGVKRIRLEYSANSTSYSNTNDWMDWQEGETWRKTLSQDFNDEDQVYIRVWAEDQSAYENDTTAYYPSNPYTVQFIIDVPISLNNTAQQIDGFGGALHFYGYNPDDDVLDKIFDSDELAATIVRVGVGVDANDPECRSRSKDPDCNSPGAPGWCSYEFDMQSSLMPKLYNRAQKLLISNWYPYGSLDHDQLIIDRIKRARDIGWRNDKPIYVSIQNEPDGSWWNPLDESELAELIKNVGQKLAEEKTGGDPDYNWNNVYLMAPEASNPPDIMSYVNVIANDISVIGYHMYSDTIISDLAGWKSNLNSIRDASSEFYHDEDDNTGKNWETETSGKWDRYKYVPYKNVIDLTSVENLEKSIFTAKLIHYALTEGNSSAFLWWGLTWADSQGQGYLTTHDHDQGLIIVNHQTEAPMEELTTTKKYYAFKHYSKYIRPGYKRINIPSTTPILTSAYKTPNNQEVVIVIVNPEDTDTMISISGLDSYTLTQVVRTNNDLNCEDIPGGWTDTVPGMSITTLVYQTSCSTDADCDDGLYCNGTDTCSGGECTHDGSPCPETVCNHCQESTDSCYDSEGTFCGSDMECDGNGNCLSVVCTLDSDCDDDVDCTEDICNTSSGSCDHNPVNASCNDGNTCTDDSCNPGSGCVYTNNTVSCNDGDPCTGGDTCSGGVCNGTPKDCSHLDDECNDGACEPGTGNCIVEPKPEGTPCNGGQCDANGNCVTTDPPELSNNQVSPSSGSPDDTYTFQVTFTDGDNDPPDTVKLFVDGVEQNNFPIPSADWSSGHTFSHSLSNSGFDYGSHYYEFKATQGAWQQTLNDSFVVNTPVTTYTLYDTIQEELTTESYSGHSVEVQFVDTSTNCRTQYKINGTSETMDEGDVEIRDNGKLIFIHESCDDDHQGHLAFAFFKLLTSPPDTAFTVTPKMTTVAPGDEVVFEIPGNTRNMGIIDEYGDCDDVSDWHWGDRSGDGSNYEIYGIVPSNATAKDYACILKFQFYDSNDRYALKIEIKVISEPDHDISVGSVVPSSGASYQSGDSISISAQVSAANGLTEFPTVTLNISGPGNYLYSDSKYPAITGTETVSFSDWDTSGLAQGE